jgi:hypothetical protein
MMTSRRLREVGATSFAGAPLPVLLRLLVNLGFGHRDDAASKLGETLKRYNSVGVGGSVAIRTIR